MTVDIENTPVSVSNIKAFYDVVKNRIEFAKSVSGTFTNAGSGWNTQSFRSAFSEAPSIVAIPNAGGYTVEVKEVDGEKFLYRLLNSSNSATAEAVEVMWIAEPRNEFMRALNAIVPTGYSTLTELLADDEAVAGLTESVEAMAMLYDDATARSVLLSSESHMNAILNSEAATNALDGHSVMKAAVLAEDMPASKYIAHEAGLAHESYSSCSALFADTGAASSLTSTASIVSLTVDSNPAISAATASDAWVDSIVANDASASAITDSDSKVVRASAAAAGLSPSSYSTLSSLMSSSSAMAKLAASDFALWLICQNSNARTAWMQSSYAHTNYSTVYSTLHGSGLFTKYETYYSTSYNPGGSGFTKYTNSTGGLSQAPTYQSFDGIAPFEGITLMPYFKASSVCYIRSSQTNAQLKQISTTEEVKLVGVGGLAWYYGNSSVRYATYVPA